MPENYFSASLTQKLTNGKKSHGQFLLTDKSKLNGGGGT